MSSTPPAHEPHGGHRRRREAAREKARLNRRKQRRRDVATRGLVRGGIAVALVAVVVVVGLIVVQGARPAGPGPQNMASDGILIGKDLAAVPTQALDPQQDPVPTESEAAGVAHIRVYVDYLCTACKEFQDTNGAQMEGWLQSGAATVEVHPVAILTSKSQGYSQRAANAAACVADTSPDDFWAFNRSLFAEQPAEQSTGLSDERITEARRSGRRLVGRRGEVHLGAALPVVGQRGHRPRPRRRHPRFQRREGRRRPGHRRRRAPVHGTAGRRQGVRGLRAAGRGSGRHVHADARTRGHPHHRALGPDRLL
ncbi:DsbA family protein [Clavibacter tessellarius]|uniref:DsbA family protein n=1 Tax=Clavibacter tessellarius TaxID=31965 RepID=UPI00324459ED